MVSRLSRKRKKSKRENIVFRTEWFRVVAKHVPHEPRFNGKPVYTIISDPAVVILAVTDSGRIILVKQYRPALNASVLELPSGAVDKGETPLGTAKRELAEEAGYTCRKWRYLGKLPVSADRFSTEVSIFYGEGARPINGFSSVEKIEAVLVTPATLRRIVGAGRLRSSMGVAALMVASLKLNRDPLQ